MRTILLLATALFSTIASASGYGWYVNSFDWSAYEGARSTIRTRYFALARKLEPTLSQADHMNMATNIAFQGCCKNYDGDQAKLGNFEPVVPLKDESPKELEFYWPVAMHYAFRAVSKRAEPKNYFLFFRNGRSFATGRAPAECEHGPSDWGYCMGAAFILSPDEIKEFHGQVARMNASTKHPADYRDYLVDLERMLARNNNGKKALLFEGHD